MNHMGSIYYISNVEKMGFCIQGLRSTASALHFKFHPSTLLSAKRRLSKLLRFWVSHMIWPLESWSLPNRLLLGGGSNQGLS